MWANKPLCCIHSPLSTTSCLEYTGFARKLQAEFSLCFQAFLCFSQQKSGETAPFFKQAFYFLKHRKKHRYNILWRCFSHCPNIDYVYLLLSFSVEIHEFFVRNLVNFQRTVSAPRDTSASARQRRPGSWSGTAEPRQAPSGSLPLCGAAHPRCIRWQRGTSRANGPRRA